MGVTDVILKPEYGCLASDAEDSPDGATTGMFRLE